MLSNGRKIENSFLSSCLVRRVLSADRGLYMSANYGIGGRETLYMTENFKPKTHEIHRRIIFTKRTNGFER